MRVFSQAFKKEARELYPDNAALQEAIEAGDAWRVESLLECADNAIVMPEVVLGMLDTEAFYVLRAAAMLAIRKNQLFLACCQVVFQSCVQEVGA